MTTSASNSRISAGPAFIALTQREIVRFVRLPSRVIASIGTPALLWLFLAGGFADSFARPVRGTLDVAAESSRAANYAAFLLPGMAIAVVLFSSIFAAMSLIEDRRAGFLQSALVSPAPRWTIVGAKALGGSLIAAAQGALILAAAPLVGLSPGPVGFALALLALALASCAVTGLGLAAAWWINSSEGFHGVMNLLLMPMWLLSGAFFPAEGAAPWLRAIMALNPLRWSLDTLRAALETPASPSLAAWTLSLTFAAAMLALASFTIARPAPRRRVLAPALAPAT